MTIRKKTLLVVGLTLLGLLVTAFVVSRGILSQGFADLEETETQVNVQRALSALSVESSDVDTLVKDWAEWDDTYAFIEDSNDEYIDSNLIDGMFISTPLDFILYVNTSFDIVWGNAFDPKAEEKTALPQDLLDHISPGDRLVNHEDVDSAVDGLLMISSAPMILASRPITTSDGEGPIRGTLVMGRYLDKTRLEKVAMTTELSLAIHRLSDPSMPVDFLEAQSTMLEQPLVIVRPLSSDSVAGYSLIHDVYGVPIAVLRAEMPRGIHAQGKATTNLLFVSLIVIALVYGLVVMWLLHRVILVRLAHLSASVVATTFDESACIWRRRAVKSCKRRQPHVG